MLVKAPGGLSRPALHNMRKERIIWLATNHCKAHRHSYLEHWQCYVREAPDQEEKIGALDIEASNLDADWGQMLSWCIKDLSTGEIYHDVLNEADISKAKNGDEDSRIVRSCIARMGKMDRLITYYGARYDVPFIRARAMITGVGFPHQHGSIKHKDVYDIVKRCFKLSSRRQENACRQLLGDTKKTKIDTRFWRSALRGDKKALAYVLDHNKADVEDLTRLWYAVKDYAKVNATSI